MKQMILGILAAAIWALNGALLVGCTKFTGSDQRTIHFYSECGDHSVEFEMNKDARDSGKSVDVPLPVIGK